MVEKPGKIQPALVGGLVLGILSSIPVVNAANCCFCLWVLVGGAIAAKLLIDKSPFPVRTGDGAVVGLIAGIVGSGVTLLLGVPLNLLMNKASLGFSMKMLEMINNPEFQEQMRRSVELSSNQSFGERLMMALISWAIGSVFYIGFATLGGLLGVALFEKRKGPQGPPPPPASFMGPQGPYPNQPPY